MSFEARNGNDDVMIRRNYVMIAKLQSSWIFPKLQETAEIERKVIITNIRELHIKRVSLFSGKTACQKLAAMVASKSMNTNRSH